MSSSQTPAPAPLPAGVGPGASPPANDTSAPGDVITATPLFLQSLSDAEELLSYAANTGRFPLEADAGKGSIKHWVIEGIINARASVERKRLTREATSAFWASFADLSRITSPVTAESLRASARNPIRALQATVLVLASVVIVTSIFFFMNSSIATQVTQLMEEQNSAALRLWSHVQYYKDADAAPDRAPGASPASVRTGGGGATAGRAFAAATQPTAATVARVTPEELFGEVVEFSRRSSWLRETAWRLNNYFIPPGLRINTAPIDFGEGHPEGMTALNVRPTIRTVSEIADEAINQIVLYQQVRNFSQAAYKTDAMVYAGITNYLLPAVYALLGATLYGLRRYAGLVRQKAYLKSSANSARYFIALIGGVVIGLFGSLLPESAPVPPLAIAFLVGYAVEAFFSRLDGFIERMRGSSGAAQPAQVAEPAVQRAVVTA